MHIIKPLDKSSKDSTKKPMAIVTMPPYGAFMEEVIKHPSVEGIRLNTVMPVKEPLDILLKRMYDLTSKYDKDLWIDLKGRQLRVKTFGVPPFTEIELTHSIKVKTPVTAYFSGGEEHATVLAVKDGNKLIMQEGPKRVVGPGESVNIIHPSLTIDGYLTDTDKKYVAAAKSLGLHKYMLSFVESHDDIKELNSLDDKAEIIAKIESKKGLEYVNSGYAKHVKEFDLMAARGDMYIELDMPHDIIGACKNIITKNDDAVVASRIFSSLADKLEPACEDIGDVYGLMSMGYKRFMFGDDICMRRDSIISGLNLFQAMAEEYVES